MNFVQTHRQFLQRHVRRRFNPAKDIFAVRIKTPLLRRTGFDRDRPLVLVAPGSPQNTPLPDDATCRTQPSAPDEYANLPNKPCSIPQIENRIMVRRLLKEK